MANVNEVFCNQVLFAPSSNLEASWGKFWDGQSQRYGLPLVDCIPAEAAMLVREKLAGKKIVVFILDVDDEMAVENVRRYLDEVADIRCLKHVFCTGSVDGGGKLFTGADYMLCFEKGNEKRMFELAAAFLLPFFVVSPIAVAFEEIEEMFRGRGAGKHYSLEIGKKDFAGHVRRLPSLEYDKLFLAMELPIHFTMADYARCLENIDGVKYSKTVLGATWHDSHDCVRINGYFTKTV